MIMASEKDINTISTPAFHASHNNIEFSPEGVYKGLLNVPSVEGNNLHDAVEEDNYAVETSSKVQFS